MLPKLNLVVIRSSDLARSVAFYRALGLAFQREAHGTGPEHHVAIVDGLVFEIYPLAPGATPTTGTRLGFCVEELDALVPRLEAAGGKVLTRPSPRGAGRAAVVADPDGHRIELTTPELG